MPNPKSPDNTFGTLMPGDYVQIPELAARRGDPLPDPVEITAAPVNCTRCPALIARYRDAETGEDRPVHGLGDREVFPAARTA